MCSEWGSNLSSVSGSDRWAWFIRKIFDFFKRKSPLEVATTRKRTRSLCVVTSENDPDRSLALRLCQPLCRARRGLQLSFNHLGQTFNRGTDHLAWVATETKHKRRSRSCCNMQAAHCPNDDAVLAACALDRDVRETPPRVSNEMHPLVRRIGRYVGAEVTLESGNQHVALIPIQQAHSTNMRCEVPLFHESGNDGLAQGRWLSIDKIAGGNERS